MLGHTDANFCQGPIIWQRTTPKGLVLAGFNPLWLDLNFAAVARIW